MEKKKFTRFPREDWNNFEFAAHTIAKAFGVTVDCSPKYDYLRTSFNQGFSTGLTPEQYAAVGVIEDLIELVSEFPEDYLRTHNPPKPKVRPSVALEANRQAIRRIVASHRATNPRVFGSVARGEDTPDSNLDILIDSIDGVTTLFGIGGMSRELKALLGVDVDVVTTGSLPEKLRANIIASAKVI